MEQPKSFYLLVSVEDKVVLNDPTDFEQCILLGEKLAIENMGKEYHIVEAMARMVVSPDNDAG